MIGLGDFIETALALNALNFNEALYKLFLNFNS
jgi:hypothetical protein